jgi:hypothetical protein
MCGWGQANYNRGKIERKGCFERYGRRIPAVFSHL